MSATTAKSSKLIVPSEWRMSREFRHSDGITYSLGSPVPAMTVREAVVLERSGFIIRADALPEAPQRVITPEFLLSGNDLQVLRRLRELKVDAAMLTRVFTLAVATQRSHILLEALRLILGIPVDTAEADRAQ